MLKAKQYWIDKKHMNYTKYKGQIKIEPLEKATVGKEITVYMDKFQKASKVSEVPVRKQNLQKANIQRIAEFHIFLVLLTTVVLR